MATDNLTILGSSDKSGISEKLAASGADGFHVNNGVYAYKAEMIVPTMLAGFQYIADNIAGQKDALLIAVNSDVSMRGIYAKQGKSEAEFAALEGQLDRALKVAGPIAEQHPGRKVLVAFYDEETPTPLYQKLAGDGVRLKTLHKWGFGTEPKAPKIEGAENFGMVLGFPLINDTKPVCHDITAKQDQSAIVRVVRLNEEIGLHGAPYLSQQGKVMFPVAASLASHRQNSLSATPAVAPATPGAPKL